MTQARLITKFVEIIPDKLEEGILYVSMRYAACMHRCACGCGRDVVTPLSPTDWQLFFDGKSITLDPSIGNWSYPCRSHYWIISNEIRWAGHMSNEAIERGRVFSKAAKGRYYGGTTNVGAGEQIDAKANATANIADHRPKAAKSAWQRFWANLLGE